MKQKLIASQIFVEEFPIEPPKTQVFVESICENKALRENWAPGFA